MKGLKINVKAAQQIKNELIIEKNEEYFTERFQCSKIFDNIYLSSYRHAVDKTFLQNQNITHIINCASGSNNFSSIQFENFQYLNLYLNDDPGYDFIYEIFCCIEFIESAVKREGKILIHCHEVK